MHNMQSFHTLIFSQSAYELHIYALTKPKLKRVKFLNLLITLSYIIKRMEKKKKTQERNGIRVVYNHIYIIHKQLTK